MRLMILACFFILPAAVADQLLIDNTFVRASIPGQNNSAAFARFDNRSQQTLTLTELKSQAAETVELHRHIHNDGQVQMRKVETFSLAPQQSLELQQQDMHIMLIGLKQPLLTGETVRINFCFAEDLCTSAEFPVTSILDEPQSHDNHQHHH